MRAGAAGTVVHAILAALRTAAVGVQSAAHGPTAAPRASTDDAVAAACAWLAQPGTTRGPAPGADAGLAADFAPALARLSTAWRAATAAAPWTDLALCTAEQTGKLRADGFTMPHVFGALASAVARPHSATLRWLASRRKQGRARCTRGRGSRSPARLAGAVLGVQGSQPGPRIPIDSAITADGWGSPAAANTA